MSSYIPKLGVDKLLDMDEAVKVIMEEECPKSIKKALVMLVKSGKIRVWLSHKGEILYQYNPESEVKRPRRDDANSKRWKYG
jgi:hypothetical protein